VWSASRSLDRLLDLPKVRLPDSPQETPPTSRRPFPSRPSHSTHRSTPFVLPTRYLAVRDAASTSVALQTPHDFFSSVKQASQLFVGITYLTMTHNEPWHFARLGRLVERADQTSRIVDVKNFMIETGSAHTIDEIQWGALLRSASAFEMYRKHFGPIVPARVVEFLIFSRRFPRSVRYCLRKAERSLHAITGGALGTASTPAERAFGRLTAEVEYAEVSEVLESGLHDWSDALQIKMNKVGASIYETFFAQHPDGGTKQR
jgi:uncharacterized alpha-E superfamily protein